MNRNLVSFTLLTALVLLVASCGIFGGKGKGASPTTGWNYNDPDNGGFEVKQAVEQETGPGLVFIEGGSFTMGRVEQDLTL